MYYIVLKVTVVFVFCEKMDVKSEQHAAIKFCCSLGKSAAVMYDLMRRHINKTVFIVLQYLDGTKNFLRAVNIYRSALERSDTEKPAACQGSGDVVFKQL